MKYQKVLDMAETFVSLAEETAYQSPVNQEFQAQRERLLKFTEYFQTSLRRIRNQMESEVGTLKMRGMDHKIWTMLTKVYNGLVELYKEINPEKPYIAGEKLVHMVLDRPNLMVLDNLEFLGKHHLKRTNVDFKPSKLFAHPDIYSIEELKRLATEVKMFMEKNPLVALPTQSTPPPPGLGEAMKEVPAFFAGKEDKTKA